MNASHQKRAEFGGRLGNLLLIVGLPLFTIYLYFALRFNGGYALLIPRVSYDWTTFFHSLVPTPRTFLLYLGWFLFQALLQQILPGSVVQGTELSDGRRLPYKMNGLLSLGVTLLVVGVLHQLHIFRLPLIYYWFGSFLSSMLLFTLVFSVFLYVWGLRYDQRGKIFGQWIPDFWMGTGHNPRIPAKDAGFDLKFFCEARPGLILWMVINVAFALTQYERWGFVSLSMWLVLAFQLMYIVDYFLHEPAILTTMDIKHENFGYMLAFGDLVWVPMTYSLQAHYLIDHVHSLPWWAAAIFIALNFLGLYIFRSVNSQKHRFRTLGDQATIWGKPVEYLTTAQGNRLLLSGFWGWSRHFNYVGDILMALSWSLPCLFGSLLPYFYPIYFAILLIHRERRDHHFCREKYGDDWDRYCERVPWRIIPKIY